MWYAILLVAVLVLALLELKTSRSDGTLQQVHPYRRLMTFVMKGRNESVVYFDDYINAEPLLEYLEADKDRAGGGPTAAFVAGAAIALFANPRMNRYIVGRRVYMRDGAWLTFSMKRQKMNKKAQLSAVKLRIGENETYADLVERMNANVKVERSGEKTYADKEFSILNALPRPVLLVAVPFLRLLDYYNLLPASFIEGDAMYTSIFIANLGSVGMNPGYHHLYEWGTCPLFIMVGKVHDRPVVRDGEVVVQKSMLVRFSYDERIDDGLTASYGITALREALENPFEALGCQKEDGSDRRVLSKPLPEPEVAAEAEPEAEPEAG